MINAETVLHCTFMRFATSSIVVPTESHIYYVKWRMVGQRRLQNFSRQKVKALKTRISAAHLCDVMSEKNCSLNGHVHYPQLSIEKTPVDIAKK